MSHKKFPILSFSNNFGTFKIVWYNGLTVGFSFSKTRPIGYLGNLN